SYDSTIMQRKDDVMRPMILFILLFSMSAIADKKCDKAGKDGSRIEVDGKSFTEKPDPDPKYKNLTFPPMLYCDAAPAKGECTAQFMHEEYINDLTKPRSAICSSKVNSVQVKAGVQAGASKLEIYVDK